jgi:hypothetical protein
MGRYGLSLEGQRGFPRKERLRQPHSPQEAAGPVMPETTRRANALKSKVRSRVEHVFVVQKDKMGLFIRTIGIARATMKIGMVSSTILGG